MDRKQIVSAFIENQGTQTIPTYFPPARVSKMLLEEKNIFVNKMYLIRLYEELGIVYENGLWIKKQKESK